MQNTGKTVELVLSQIYNPQKLKALQPDDQQNEPKTSENGNNDNKKTDLNDEMKSPFQSQQLPMATSNEISNGPKTNENGNLDAKQNDRSITAKSMPDLPKVICPKK